MKRFLMCALMLVAIFAVCITLQPTVALADATDGKATIKYGLTGYELQGFDTPIYTVNSYDEAEDTDGNWFTTWSQTTYGASASDWNTKIEWKSGEPGPTITLRGARFVMLNQETGKMATNDQTYLINTPTDVPTTIIVTGEDSVVAGKFGITFKGDLTIKSEGNTKLTVDGYSSAIDSNGRAGASLTIDANLDAKIHSYYTTYPGGAVLHTKQADINILGGNINVESLPSSHVKCIAAEESGNINIKSGNITVKNNITSAAGTFGAILAKGGKIVIDSGSITANTNQSVALNSGVGIEINGGDVKIDTQWYGITTTNGADVLINGGIVEILGSRDDFGGAFYSKAPVLGPGVVAIAGTSEDDADSYDETKFRDAYFKSIPYCSHTREKTEAVAPTCTADGNSAYWYCQICEKYYGHESEQQIILKDSWILPAAHTEEILPAKPQTDVETGLTEGLKCSVCGEILIEQEIIPAGYLIFTLRSDGKSYMVSSCSIAAFGELKIPASYKGLPVTAVASGAFKDCTELTKVVIPDSVTSIGEAAFSGCRSLESITVPFVGDKKEPLNDYRKYPFGYIFGTSSYTGGRETKQRYFYYRDSSVIITYYIPVSLKSVTVTGGEINYGAFYNCVGLTNVTIKGRPTFIDDYAFYNCDGLTDITIPGSVSTIGDYAFYNCTGLTSVTIPDSVTTIGDSAFYNCTGLTSVTIPDSVTTIGDSAFSSCTGLTSITIPDSVTTIGIFAFSSCTKLTNVYITDIAAWCGITFRNNYHNYAYANPLSYADNLYLNGELVTDLVILDGVTCINAYAFYNCDGLTSVTIPDSVTTIDYYAFYDCDGLTSVTIGNGVTTIGGRAFYDCDGLTSVTIGNGVTTIGYSAFYGCYALQSVLTHSVHTVEESAFSTCFNLVRVYFKGTQEEWNWIIFEADNSYLQNAKVFFEFPGDTNPEIDHTVEIAPYKAPTCTETGLTEGLKCADCGQVIIPQEEIPATGIHTEEILPAVPACTGAGLTEGKKCSVCGEILVAQQELPVTPHTEITVSAVAPTCTSAGITEGKYCTSCQTMLVPLQVIPAIGHTEEIIPAVAPTCSEYGWTEGKKCSTCGQILLSQSRIPKLSHTEEILPGKAATCTEDGLTEGKKCSVCNTVLITQHVIPALGHKEVPVAAIAPTCTTSGNTEGRYCYVCAKMTLAPQYVPANGHTEEIIPGKAAICTEDGITEGKKCTICLETLISQEVIPATGHSEEIIPGVPASCKTGLTEGKKCSTCGVILLAQEVIPATGTHTEQEFSGVAPTCTTGGLSNGLKCTACGKILKAQEPLPALGHTEVTVPGKAATCTETGLTDGIKCSVCGVLLQARESVPALGHSYDHDFDADCNICGDVRELNNTFMFENYRVIFSDNNETHKNLRVVIYNLGDQTVTNPADEKALKEIDADPVTRWGTSNINKICITDAGNYVLMLKYNVDTSVVNVPLVVSVSPDPKLIIDNNNKITLIDNDEANTNHRVVVYYLGEDTVDDFYDTAALQNIDLEPKTHWQKSRINRLALTKGGSYVLHLEYNVGSEKRTVAQQFTVASIPVLSVNQNNMLVVTEENAENKNHRVTVYYLADGAVEDPFDETAVTNAAVSSKTYWGLNAINAAEITEGGNYVIHLYYNVGNSAKRTLALDVTLNDRPVLSVDASGKLSVECDDPAISNHRAYIYNIGDADVEDIYDEAALNAIATPSTVWGLNAISKKTLTPGNYVIHLYYNVNGSAKKTVALKVTI